MLFLENSSLKLFNGHPSQFFFLQKASTLFTRHHEWMNLLATRETVTPVLKISFLATSPPPLTTHPMGGDKMLSPFYL